MRIGERIKRLKQRLRKRGVTMLELVMALGLLFVAAGGVMTILAAGAGYPRHTQWVVVRDALAKLKLDSLTARATQPANAAYAPYPGNPDYDVKVDAFAATWNPNDIWITVTVKGPKPMQVESSITGMIVKTVGSDLFFATYNCDSCHTIGNGPGSTGPNLNGDTLAKGMAARNAALGGSLTLDQYITESVRQPENYKVIDPETGAAYVGSMTEYPTTTDMSDTDIQAISAFLQSL